MANELLQSDCTTPLSRNRSEQRSNGNYSRDDVMLTQSRSTPPAILTPIRDLTPDSRNWLIRARVAILGKRRFKEGDGEVMYMKLMDCSEPVSGAT